MSAWSSRMEASRSIVYLAEGTWAGDASLQRALAFARTAGARLTVLREGVPRAPSVTPGHTGAPSHSSAIQGSDEWDDVLPAGPHVEIRPLRPRPGPDVIREAVSETAALVVKVAEDRPADRLLMRSLPCSLWLHPPNSAPRDRVILAGVELREDEADPVDTAVVRLASVLARSEGARLLVVHAWSLIGESIVTCTMRGLGPVRARQLLAQIRGEHRHRLDQLLTSAGVDGEALWEMEKGTAPSVIRAALRRTRASTLVIGYHGRSGIWRLVQGNLAESFIGMPGRSLIAVRPGGWAPEVADRSRPRSA